MHVLGVGPPGERAGAEILGDLFEGTDDRGRLRRGDDPLPPEHPRVGDAPAHVVQRDALVELERSGERADRGIQRPREAARPERLLGHRFFFWVGFLAAAFGAASSFFGTSSAAAVPSPHSACVRSDMPKTVMKPSDALWSKRSPLPYVASAVEYSECGDRRPTIVSTPRSRRTRISPETKRCVLRT